MKTLLSLGTVLLAMLPAAAAAKPLYPAAGPGIAAPGTVSQFQVTDKTEVPGHTLKPGSYSITVVDHLTDRMVLRVDGSDGKQEAIFLAIPGTNSLSAQGSAGPLDMKAGKGAHAALRGFRFQDGSTAEFVYPKAEAVSLAKANSTTDSGDRSGVRGAAGCLQAFA